VASSPVEKRPWRLALPIPACLVCSCGAAQIAAPVGSTAATVFTCRACCARIQRRRNVESLLKNREGHLIVEAPVLSIEQSEISEAP
jgi:hypothetical protein